jgi:hypothetical protein
MVMMRENGVGVTKSSINCKIDAMLQIKQIIHVHTHNNKKVLPHKSVRDLGQRNVGSVGCGS